MLACGRERCGCSECEAKYGGGGTCGSGIVSSEVE